MILHEFGRASRVSEFANSGSHKLLRQGLVLEPTDAALSLVSGRSQAIILAKRQYRLSSANIPNGRETLT